MSQFEEILSQNSKLTPMMSQYADIKKNYRDVLLLFRMGDFYELFFDDAIIASKILNIALTHRGKIGDIPIPMCGIPHHAAANYIDRITLQGKKAAICEQVEDPKSAKGIVKRAVVQIVGPSIPYDLNKIEVRENYYVCTSYEKNNIFYTSFLDFTTGDFLAVIDTNIASLIDHIKKYNPKEFLCFSGQWENQIDLLKLIEAEKISVTFLSNEIFKAKNTTSYINNLIPNFQHDSILNTNKEILVSIGVIAFYIQSTQNLENLTHIAKLKIISPNKKLIVSMDTLVGLDILPRSFSNKNNSLLGFYDKTITSMASRKLKNIFLNPLDDEFEIENRLNLVEYFIKNSEEMTNIREILREVIDIERVLAKLNVKKANTQDLIFLTESIQHYIKIKNKINLNNKSILKEYENLNCGQLEEIYNIVKKTFNSDLNASIEKGNLINEGVNSERDRLADLAFKSEKLLKELETKYREKTGITNLKVKSNNIFGYYIEISKSHKNKVLSEFERKQTLVNCERYTSTELDKLETKVLAAKLKLENLERKIFQDISLQCLNLSDQYSKLKEYLVLVDIFSTFSHIAIQENFTRPLIVSDKIKELNIVGAFHPLLKNKINAPYVEHDLHLSDEYFFALITGPNMAGKTTVMREMSIIQFLAQIGSYVPAKSAKITLKDFLFSRLGANDNIQQGQSTFMVEMTETAEILRHATPRSLVLFDEVGRGTSTFDGLSIAWAIVDYMLTKIKCITLFSTHYHELINLVDSLPCGKNFNVSTQTINGDIKFLYQLVEGGTFDSFGIFVAKKAGLPNEVIVHAKEKLKHFNSIKNKKDKKNNHHSNQQSFIDFDKLVPESNNYLVSNSYQEFLAEFSNLDPNTMTPIQALKKLDDFKIKAKNLIQ